MRLPRRLFVVNGIYLNSFIKILKQINFLIKAERLRSIFWRVCYFEFFLGATEQVQR